MPESTTGAAQKDTINVVRTSLRLSALREPDSMMMEVLTCLGLIIAMFVFVLRDSSSDAWIPMVLMFMPFMILLWVNWSGTMSLADDVVAYADCLHVVRRGRATRIARRHIQYLEYSPPTNNHPARLSVFLSISSKFGTCIRFVPTPGFQIRWVDDPLAEPLLRRIRVPHGEANPYAKPIAREVMPAQRADEAQTIALEASETAHHNERSPHRAAENQVVFHPFVFSGRSLTVDKRFLLALVLLLVVFLLVLVIDESRYALKRIPQALLLFGAAWFYYREVASLADEVVVHSDHLRIRKGKRVAKIAFEDITHIDHSEGYSEQLSLWLKHKSALGTHIVFKPRADHYKHWKRHPKLAQLLDKIER
jgi:Ca2+/Na+ antiporter